MKVTVFQRREVTEAETPASGHMVSTQGGCDMIEGLRLNPNHLFKRARDSSKQCHGASALNEK